MENVTMNEKAIIIDEQLENISGGKNNFNTLVQFCDCCKKRAPKHEIVFYNNRRVCKTCMEKFNK